MAIKKGEIYPVYPPMFPIAILTRLVLQAGERVYFGSRLVLVNEQMSYEKVRKFNFHLDDSKKIVAVSLEDCEAKEDTEILVELGNDEIR